MKNIMDNQPLLKKDFDVFVVQYEETMTALKHDLDETVKKKDLEEFEVKIMGGVATKDDIKNMATKDDLQGMEERINIQMSEKMDIILTGNGKVVRKLDQILKEQKANIAAHERFDEEIKRIKVHIGLSGA